MKKILISIKPEYASKIYDGEKTVELRKRIGKDFQRGCKLYIYSSSPVKMLTGEAEIGEILCASPEQIKKQLFAVAGITHAAFDEYFKGSPKGYAIFLKNVREYEKKIPLPVLRAKGITPPQSFSYLNEEHASLMRGY